MKNKDLNYCKKCGEKINAINADLSKFKNISIQQKVKCKNCGFENEISTKTK